MSECCAKKQNLITKFFKNFFNKLDENLKEKAKEKPCCSKSGEKKKSCC